MWESGPAFCLMYVSFLSYRPYERLLQTTTAYSGEPATWWPLSPPVPNDPQKVPTQEFFLPLKCLISGCKNGYTDLN